jgi:hypothetical protein
MPIFKVLFFEVLKDTFTYFCKRLGFHGSDYEECLLLRCGASETSVHTRFTQRLIPEDGIPLTYFCLQSSGTNYIFNFVKNSFIDFLIGKIRHRLICGLTWYFVMQKETFRNDCMHVLW